MLRASLRRIEVFVAVAEAGGFSAAADRLGIAQPSVSAHVRGLEAELGGPPLLERRDGRRPSLTEEGEAFLRRARAMLAEARAVEAEAASGRRRASRRVVLACQPHITNFVLPDLLAGFVRDAPGLELVLRSGASETVAARVRDGTADLGCMLGTPEEEGLRCRRIGEERYVLVAAPDHPLTRRRAIPPGELAPHPFVGGPRNALLTRQVAALAAAIGVPAMRVAARASEYNMRRAYVQAGMGLLWTPATSAAPDLRDERLAVLDLDAPPLVVPIHLVRRARHVLTAPAADLAAYLASRLAGRIAS